MVSALHRVTCTDDVQMFGAVHGGIILGMMEEAGTILTTQYCSRFVSYTQRYFDNIDASCKPVATFLPSPDVAVFSDHRVFVECQVNSDEEGEVTAALGSMEKAEFLLPVMNGDLCEVHACLGFTSSHSVEVIANVYAVKPSSGTSFYICT